MGQEAFAICINHLRFSGCYTYDQN